MTPKNPPRTNSHPPRRCVRSHTTSLHEVHGWEQGPKQELLDLICSLKQQTITQCLGCLPEKKEYQESITEPTFIDVQSTGCVTGFNEAIDQAVAKMKALLEQEGGEE